MNSISLIGRTTNEIEIRTTQTGNVVASFSLAVKRPYTKDKTDFFNVIAWDKKAELLKQYVSKGNMVGIGGYVQIRTYEKDGQTRYITEVIVENVDLIGGQQQPSQRPELPNEHYSAPPQFGGFPGMPTLPADDDLPL